MKKEIGGYLELEESTGQEYYPELCGVNLGRTALLWLMEARNCKKIYLPTYLCDSVTGACEETKVEIEFYHMDEKLCPLLPEKKLPDGEYLYLVNYYGQLTDDRIRQYREIYGNIIADPQEFPAGVQSIHARQRLLKKCMCMIHDNVSVNFPILPDSVIGQLSVVIYKVKIFTIRKFLFRQKRT